MFETLASMTLGLALAGAGPEAAPSTTEATSANAPTYVYGPGNARVPAGTKPPRPELRSSSVAWTAGGMVMMRGVLLRMRNTDGDVVRDEQLRMLLRPRLGAEIGNLRMLAEYQDARRLENPPSSARHGFHQLFFEYGAKTRLGEVSVRAGRQEIVLGDWQLYAHSPWSMFMRSWDALRVDATIGRARLLVFGGSLARPLASANQPLLEHVAGEVNLTWGAQGGYRFAEAFEGELMVSGGHTRVPGDVRDITTTTLRAFGGIPVGFSYQLQGALQLGTMEIAGLRQGHLAGYAFVDLDYLTPRGFASGESKLGVHVAGEYVSGGRCTTTDFGRFDPCTQGTNHDFEAPWRAHHRWLGHADRFRAINVIDTFGGLRLVNRITPDARLDVVVDNHVFMLANPGGRWVDVGGNLVGVDPDNRRRLVANELDTRARFFYRWFWIELSWSLVANVGAGPELSGERLRHQAYLWLVIDL